jgi:hypothetical protein
MAGEVKEIELWPCGYEATCRVKNCSATATIIACAVDGIGRPSMQYELCVPHAEQIAKRERGKGRAIVQ